jgi:hypothetical protein
MVVIKSPRRGPARASNQISTTSLPSNLIEGLDLSRAGTENYRETLRSVVPSRVL